MDTITTVQKGKGKGFASFPEEKRREIASKGGKAAHAQGTAHTWTSEEAAVAGSIGGKRSRPYSRQIQHPQVPA